MKQELIQQKLVQQQEFTQQQELVQITIHKLTIDNAREFLKKLDPKFKIQDPLTKAKRIFHILRDLTEIRGRKYHKF